MGDDKEKQGTGWMYNPVSEINREDYLLGKKIGKDFDAEGTMGKINDVEYDCTPASIFSSQAGHQVDIQRKLLEDPLVSIKKREAEDRKKVLDNPVKMKALNEHIAAMKKSQKKKKKKKKKKGSDSDSDEDLDSKLLKRIQRMEQGGGGSEEDESEEEQETKKKKKKHKNKESRRERSRSRSPQRRQRSASRSPERRRRRRSPSNSPPRRRRSPSNSPPKRRRSPSNSPPRRRRRSPSKSPPRRRRSPSGSPQRRKRRSPSKSPPRRRKSPSDSPPRRRNRSRSTSTPPRKRAGLDLMGKVKTENGQSDGKRYSPPSSKLSSQVTRKKPMTEEEKQAKLAEMMANADWRDEQRTTRVMKHRREQEKEVEEHEGGEHDTNFINRELARAQGSLTVEGRLTANKYKLQRGHGTMDQNFAKR